MKRIKLGLGGRTAIAVAALGVTATVFAATQLLKDINPGATDSLPGDSSAGFTPLGSKLVFSATTAGAATDHGLEPWITDGTVAGTIELADLNTGTGDSAPQGFAPYSGKLFFAATGPAGRELYSTDGTAVGTTLAKEFYAGGTDSSPDQLAQAQNELWLRAQVADPVNFPGAADYGFEPVRFNGSRYEVIDIYVGATGSTPTNFNQVGGLVTFIADDNTTAPAGPDLTIFDPTIASAQADEKTTTKPTVMSAATATISTARITTLALDNGSGTTKPLTPNNTCTVEAPSDGTLFNGKLYFSALVNNCTTNAALVTPQGTLPANTVADYGRELVVYSPSDTSYPYAKTPAGGITFAGYARLVKDVNPAAGNGLAANPLAIPTFLNTPVGLVASNQMFFLADDGTSGVELWVTDGTAAGTHLTKDIYAGNNSGPNVAFGAAVLGSKIYFAASDGVSGVEPYVSDGTLAGTKQIQDIYAGANDSITAAYSFSKVDSKVYFAAENGTAGQEPWRTDGTTTGTSQLIDVVPGATGSNPHWFSSVGGKLVFSANDNSHGQELMFEDTVLGDGTSGSGGGVPTGSSGDSGDDDDGGGGCTLGEGGIELGLMAGLAGLALARRRRKSKLN